MPALIDGRAFGRAFAVSALGSFAFIRISIFLRMKSSEDNNIVQAFRDSIPVMLGYVPLGIVFGFLFTQAGGAAWLAPVASVLIYGGAVQYMMVPMLAAGSSVLAIAFATAVLNLRHVFYGLPLLRKMPEKGFRRWYCVFALTDETFSLLSLYPENAPKERVFWLSLFNHCWWIAGSALGAAIGASAQIDLAGLDFVLASLFAMLMCELWRQRFSAWPLWSAFAGYGLARWLVPDNPLAASIGFCMVAGLVWGRMRRGKGEAAAIDGGR